MTLTTLSDRAVVRLSGDDVQAFLQSLVTNDVSGSLPIYNALLTPQGKMLFDFFVWIDGDDALIDCEAARAEALVKRLTLYRLRRAITISFDPELAVHWSMDAGEAADPRLAALGQRWLAPPTGGDTSDEYHAHRLSLGVTEGVAELGDGTTLWLECNAAELNGVSFTKGCYVGQENTARMNWRSTVNRRLVVVPIADADPARGRIAYPALGWSVEHRRVDDISADAWRGWMGPR
ncbi:MAG: folate-binding protein [Pseudomonadota bacterium]